MRRPPRAALLDAFGTLVELDPPMPAITRLLADAGHPFPAADVERAVHAEMRYYRAHHDRGRDAASLAVLRRECAAVLSAELGPGAPEGEAMVAVLLGSLRFRAAADAGAALDALRAAGVRTAVVSNWDAGLPAVLEEVGLMGRLDALAVSAVVGAAKPDPAIFHHALERLGVAPGDALHCGDRPETDCVGARAAGVRAVLLDREGRHDDGPCPRVRGLMELPALLG